MLVEIRCTGVDYDSVTDSAAYKFKAQLIIYKLNQGQAFYVGEKSDEISKDKNSINTIYI